MARPIPDNIRDLSKLETDIKPKETRSAVDTAIDCIKSKSSKNFVLGTVCGWFAGITVARVGKIAAFGLGVRPIPLATLAPVIDQDRLPPDLMPKASEALQVNPFRPEDTNVYDKPYLPKPIPHSPKISPSSIPNPSPSVTTNKHTDTGYPNYGGYLYSVPGFSAFQPVSYPGVVQPNPAPIHPENNREYIPFPPMAPKEPIKEENNTERPTEKPQTDFEEHFTPEIIPAVSIVENTQTESIISITCLAQSSGTTVTIPSPSGVSLVSKPMIKSLPMHSVASTLSQTMVNTSSVSIETISSPAITTTLSQNIPTVPLSLAKTPKQKMDIELSQTLANTPLKNVVNLSSSNPGNISSYNTVQVPSPAPVTTSPPTSTNISLPSIVTPLTRTIGPVQSQLPITIPSQITVALPSVTTQSQPIKEVKKKPERFSLKTSIPISKIDMKCVNPPDPIFQNSLPKKSIQLNAPPLKSDTQPKIEIQSNIVIKSATKEPEVKPDSKTISIQNNSISALLNAAEVIHKNEAQFRIPEPRHDVHEIKDHSLSQSRFNSSNIDRKATFPNKSQDVSNEKKNQILFIQNKPANPKMLLTVQQQNPQVLLQRANLDPKNLQAPSRLSNQSKKCKEDIINDNTTSKVVALKRLHQDNYDENDFENLITENQIYGNKIVVKEKSQGTLQEQDLTKNKMPEKQPTETKNVVLQPNFLYLSNVQFPANLMMIKNNTKLNQTNDTNKIKVTSIENNETNEINIVQTQSTNSTDLNTKQNKTQNTSSKDIHVLKSSNNVLHTLQNKNNKPDIDTQANQKVTNSQIVYQLPPTTENDNKINQTFVNRQYPNIIQNNEFDNTSNDKLYIACPYQMDAKLQPKIVITNIRPKVGKSDEVSLLDIYEKKKEMKRLKYLSKHIKETQKTDKKQEKTEVTRHIITPKNMKAEIYEELLYNNMRRDKESSESGSDYDGEDLKQYEAIIKEFGVLKEDNGGKVKFLASLNLATQDCFKEKVMDRQERVLRVDSVASACIAAGRLDRLAHDTTDLSSPSTKTSIITQKIEKNDQVEESGRTLRRKQVFLSQMKLLQVTTQYKEEYERTWQNILIDRKRRYGALDSGDKVKLAKRMLEIDSNSQLQLMTEIKKCVNENNNLIKKKLDSIYSDSNEDSIRILAEKNFSELNRLSKMADRSVKLFSGQDMKKRDLNPGFDSENIQRHLDSIEKHFPSINIPNISKIIALKSVHESTTVTSTQATSMDEPQNSAAGVSKMFDGVSNIKDNNCEIGCQADEIWPGVNIILKMYKDFETARKREIAELHRRSTSLRVEGVHITRAASCESDKAQVLLAERQNLAAEENKLRTSIQRLRTAIEVIRDS